MTEEIKVIPTNSTSADDVAYAKKVKEIYIDGVNVAGCKYLNKVVNEEPYYNIDEEHLYTCSSNENCYYKQLKRLEQENKELKKEIESQKGLITVGGKQQYEMTMAYDKCKSALEEIRNLVSNNDNYFTEDITKIIDEVMNE